MKKILIFGATSAIAAAAADILAARGDALYLVARDPGKLAALAQELRRTGAAVHTETMDAGDVAAHRGLIARADDKLGGMDALLVAHGVLSDQDACAADAAAALEDIKTNALSVISLVTPAANLFESRKGGVIAVISSVAGDRGRRKNYIYGAAKAMVTAFLSGLRGRLAPHGVRVLTVKPGLVDTPMTRNMKKNGLWASPQRVARDIVAALDRKNGEIYTPAFWRFIMLAIRALPESLFMRLEI